MDKDRRAGTDSRLARLEELKGFRVAEGEQDIRGWKVQTADGIDAGKIEDLIVDPEARRVRYIELKANRKALGLDEDRHILVPIGSARIDEDDKRVIVERLPAAGLAGAPAYKRGSISREYEASLRDYYGRPASGDDAEFYRDELYSDSGFRRSAPDGSQRSALPRFGDNEVTIPLVGDQEIIVRQPGSDDEIVIRKKRDADHDTLDEQRR